MNNSIVSMDDLKKIDLAIGLSLLIDNEEINYTHFLKIMNNETLDSEIEWKLRESVAEYIEHFKEEIYSMYRFSSEINFEERIVIFSKIDAKLDCLKNKNFHHINNVFNGDNGLFCVLKRYIELNYLYYNYVMDNFECFATRLADLLSRVGYISDISPSYTDFNQIAVYNSISNLITELHFRVNYRKMENYREKIQKLNDINEGHVLQKANFCVSELKVYSDDEINKIFDELNEMFKETKIPDLEIESYIKKHQMRHLRYNRHPYNIVARHNCCILNWMEHMKIIKNIEFFPFTFIKYIPFSIKNHDYQYFNGKLLSDISKGLKILSESINIDINSYIDSIDNKIFNITDETIGKSNMSFEDIIEKIIEEISIVFTKIITKVEGLNVIPKKEDGEETSPIISVTPKGSDTPTEESGTPTEESDAPTEEPDVPTEESDFPTEESDFPTEESDFPTEEPDVPTEEPPEELPTFTAKLRATLVNGRQNHKKKIKPYAVCGGALTFVAAVSAILIYKYGLPHFPFAKDNQDTSNMGIEDIFAGSSSADISSDEYPILGDDTEEVIGADITEDAEDKYLEQADALNLITGYVQPQTIDDAIEQAHKFVEIIQGNEDKYSKDDITKIVYYLNGVDTSLTSNEVSNALLDIATSASIDAVNAASNGDDYTQVSKPFMMSSFFVEGTNGLQALQALDYANNTMLFNAETINGYYWSSGIEDEIGLCIVGDYRYGVNFFDDNVPATIRLAYASLAIGYNSAAAILYSDAQNASIPYNGKTFLIGEVFSPAPYTLIIDQACKSMDDGDKTF